MASTDSLLFLSINNSSKVHCVSRITLRHKWTAEIESPRCLAAYEGNLFVTGWSGSYVYVLSQDNGAVLDSINVSFGSDAIAIAEDKLFVAVSDWTGPYKLAVIDLPSYNVNLYDISDVPNSFAVVGQNVYLLCSGYTDWSGNGADSEAKLWRYSLLSNTLEVAAIAPNVNAHASSLTTDGVNLYWLNEAYGGAVVKWFNGDSWPNTTLTLSGAYQVQYLDGFLYYFDAKDYVSNGVVYKFTTDGTYLDSIDAGVIPRQILN
jgi:outer membrane protein assembly factor BamB